MCYNITNTKINEIWLLSYKVYAKTHIHQQLIDSVTKTVIKMRDMLQEWKGKNLYCKET